MKKAGRTLVDEARPAASSDGGQSLASSSSGGLAAFGAFTALVAIIVAVYSCHISNSALDLAREQFAGDRTLILKGSVDREGYSMTLIPINSSHELLRARVTFPPQLVTQSWSVTPPNLYLPLVVPIDAVEEFLMVRLHPDPDKYMVNPELHFPIIIDSHYVAEGASYQARSLYSIMVNYVFRGGAGERPKVSVKGLQFIRHLDDSEDPVGVLGALWSEAEAQREPN